jgi:hypothetical protein
MSRHVIWTFVCMTKDLVLWRELVQGVLHVPKLSRSAAEPSPRSLQRTLRSNGTSGSAFSLIVNEALVWVTA